MAVSECPACTYHIAVQGNMQEGEVISCPDCGAKIKLVRIYPPIFELIEEND